MHMVFGRSALDIFGSICQCVNKPTGLPGIIEMGNRIKTRTEISKVAGLIVTEDDGGEIVSRTHSSMVWNLKNPQNMIAVTESHLGNVFLEKYYSFKSGLSAINVVDTTINVVAKQSVQNHLPKISYVCYRVNISSLNSICNYI
jgi:hypothetical protein